jgi:hypothetical protein
VPGVVYSVREFDSIEVRIEVHSPEDGRGIVATVAGTDVIDGLGGTRHDLDRFRSVTFTGSIKPSNMLAARNVPVRLHTEPNGAGGFSLGPELDIAFKVSKRPWRVAVAVATATIMIICATLALHEDFSIEWRVALALVAAGAGVLTVLVWTGKVGMPSFKG